MIKFLTIAILKLLFLTSKQAPIFYWYKANFVKLPAAPRYLLMTRLNLPENRLTLLENRMTGPKVSVMTKNNWMTSLLPIGFSPIEYIFCETTEVCLIVKKATKMYWKWLYWTLKFVMIMFMVLWWVLQVLYFFTWRLYIRYSVKKEESVSGCVGDDVSVCWFHGVREIF